MRAMVARVNDKAAARLAAAVEDELVAGSIVMETEMLGSAGMYDGYCGGWGPEAELVRLADGRMAVAVVHSVWAGWETDHFRAA